MALTDKLTAIADGFRTSRGTEQKYTLDEMAVLAAEKVGGGGIEGDYYYNGILLPDIPNDGYPYAFIMRRATSYVLVKSSTKYYHSGLKTVGDTKTLVRNYRIYFKDLTTPEVTWTFYGDTAYSWSDLVVWSNYDIQEGSYNSSEIYLNASAPVPVRGGLPGGDGGANADTGRLHYNGLYALSGAWLFKENISNTGWAATDTSGYVEINFESTRIGSTETESFVGMRIAYFNGSYHYLQYKDAEIKSVMVYKWEDGRNSYPDIPNNLWANEQSRKVYFGQEPLEISNATFLDWFLANATPTHKE